MGIIKVKHYSSLQGKVYNYSRNSTGSMRFKSDKKNVVHHNSYKKMFSDLENNYKLK